MTLETNDAKQELWPRTTSEQTVSDQSSRPSKRSKDRQGFLPINTNTFDRVFISIVCFIAIHLLWFRFLEASLSINIATVLTLILAFIIIRWG